MIKPSASVQGPGDSVLRLDGAKIHTMPFVCMDILITWNGVLLCP